MYLKIFNHIHFKNKMKQIPCNIYLNLLENALIGHSSNELPGGLNLAETALQSANQEDSSDCTKR